MNIMLIGDPGTGKSQLIKQVSEKAPRAIYTSGKGSSAAGLTACVIKDDNTGNLTLEAGALVIADGGLAAIDEFEKMRGRDRTAIHEVMTQNTVNIAKAGIIATLNARTSIITACNPKNSTWDDDSTPAQNINLPASILDRFDLIFVVRDKPNKEKDLQLATHILDVHSEKPKDSLIPKIEPALLKKYVRYARNEIHPNLKQDAKDAILQFYLDMRNSNKERNAPVPIAARALEGIVRMCKARARQALRDNINIDDVEAIKRLVLHSMREFSYDEERQVFNVGLAYGGMAKTKFEKSKELLKIIETLAESCKDGYVQYDFIHQAALFKDMKDEEIPKLLGMMKENNLIREFRGSYHIMK